MKDAVQAIAVTIEARDPHSAGHQQHMDSVVSAIAKGMAELSIERAYVLRQAVHDIGKISVPAEILSSPGQLNVIEFSLIRLHPKVGYEVLKTIPLLRFAKQQIAKVFDFEL